MQAKSVVALFVTVVLLSMPLCPIWAGTPQMSSDHNCHGEQQEHQRHNMNACCEDDVIAVSTFYPVEGASLDFPLLLTQTLGDLSLATIIAPAFLNGVLPLETGKHLAELSL